MQTIERQDVAEPPLDMSPPHTAPGERFCCGDCGGKHRLRTDQGNPHRLGYWCLGVWRLAGGGQPLRLPPAAVH